MGKLKMFAVAVLAAAVIGVGGLVAAPSASAAPKTCEQALALARAYIAAAMSCSPSATPLPRPATTGAPRA